MADLTRVESECVDETVVRYRDVPIDDIVTHLPEHGRRDRRRPPAECSWLGADRGARPAGPGLCGSAAASRRLRSTPGDVLRLDTDITLRNYADADHTGVLDAAADDILEFITARYEHGPPPAGCT